MNFLKLVSLVLIIQASAVALAYEVSGLEFSDTDSSDGVAITEFENKYGLAAWAAVCTPGPGNGKKYPFYPGTAEQCSYDHKEVFISYYGRETAEVVWVEICPKILSQ